MELLCVYIYRYISLTILSKEVEKLNFRQYGQMKKTEQGTGREKRKFRRERVRRKKMQMREKVQGKSRFTVFFQ